MLQIGWMQPHEPNPTPRKIEVDLSAILIRPRKPESTEVGQRSESETIFHKPIDPSIDANDMRIGPFTWTNINFVVGSCLIALLCTVFFSDNFEYARRRAHLKDDVVYPRPELDSTRTGGLSLEPAQLVSDLQLDHAKIPGVNEKGADINPNPGLSTRQPTRELQTLASSPNLSRIADSAPASNSSSASSDSGARNSVSQATSSTSMSSSRGGRSISGRSSTTKLTRHSGTSSVSSRTRSVRDGQSLRRSFANRAGGRGPGKSLSQITRQTISGVKLNNHQSRIGAVQTQTAAARNIMSMHSTGQGSALTQSRGAMNPIRMESGMLAQPSIGAGLGGLSGNGLGGGAGNHGGNARR